MALDTRSLDYKPIHLDKRELRLLEIQTGRDVNDPVISRMSNVRVTADLEFVGLCALLRDSEENSTEDLWVNACKVSVPTNIGQALRHLRSLFLRDKTALYPASAANTFSPAPPRPQPRAKKQPGWLKHLVRGFRDILPDEPGQSSRSTPLRVWLDCLCINLRNPDEAEQRRAHLSLAYESARTTLGWLGPKDPTSDGALRVFKQLDNLFPPNFGDPQDRIDHPENYSPRMTWLAPVGPAWEEDAKVNGNPEDGPQYIAVKNFLNRPFFKRQWILEELTLARCPGFLLGDELVSYKEILHWNQIDSKPFHSNPSQLPSLHLSSSYLRQEFSARSYTS